MPFDIKAALKDGYTSTQIADFLGPQRGFDVEGARKDGYSDDQIVKYLGQAKSGFGAATKAGWHESLGAAEKAIGDITGSEAFKGYAAENAAKARAEYTPTTAEDIAAAQGMLPTAGAWLSKNVTEPVGGIIGAYGAPTAAGFAAPFLAPEAVAGAAALGGEELLAATAANAARKRIVGGIAGSTVAAPAEVGRNIQAQEQAHPEEAVNLVNAVLTAIPQAALVGFGMSGTRYINKLGPALLPEAEALAPKVVSGELTREEATKLLTGKVPTYLKAMATNTVAGTGMMVGTEELRRVQAGQDLMTPSEIGETVETAGILSPIFAGLHPSGRGAANARLAEAEKTFKTKQEADLAAINAERQRQADIARQAQLDNEFNTKMQQVLKPQEALALPPARQEQQVVFPDGTVGTHADAEAWIASLPEEQQVAARAKLMGLGAQPVDVVAPAPVVPGIRPATTLSPKDLIEQSTGVTREPTKLTKKMVEETLASPSGQRIKDPVTQVEREATYGELIQRQFPEMDKTQLKDHVYKHQDLLPLSTSIEEVASKRLGETKQQDLFAEAPLTSLVPKLDKDTLTSLVPDLKPQAGVFKRLIDKSIDSPEAMKQLQDELAKLGTDKRINEAKLKEIEDAYKATTERQATESTATESGRETAGDSLQDTGGLGRGAADTSGAARSDVRRMDATRSLVPESTGGAGGKPATLREQQFAERARQAEAERQQAKADALAQARQEQETIRLQQEAATTRAEQERLAKEAQAKADEAAQLATEELPTIDERANEPDVYERTSAGEAKELSEPNPVFMQKLPEVMASVRSDLNKMGLSRVAARLEPKLLGRSGRPIAGEYSRGDAGDKVERQKLIELSLAQTEEQFNKSLNHEAIHAMRDINLFTNADWKILSQKAEREWINKYNIKERWPFLEQMKDKDAQIEEAIAEAFADYKTQPANIKSIFTRIKEFFNKLGNAFKAGGFDTSETVFKRAAEGKLKGKPFYFYADKTGKPLYREKETPPPREDLDRLWKATGAKEKVEEQGSSAFQEFKEDPKEFAKAQTSKLQRAADKFETMVFSSDAALNKAIHRAIKEAGLSDEAIKQLAMDISTSQALHSEAEAHQFLMDGGIKYNPELHKFETFEDPNGSWKSTIDAIKEAAEAQGVPYAEMEKYAHKALEARRLALDVEPFNERLLNKIINKIQSGELTEAQGRQEWRDNSKEVHMSKEQIAAGMEMFNKIPELNKVVERWDNVRKNVIDFAVETGLYSEEKAADLFDTLAYVPFFRVEQLENQSGPKEFTRGLLDAATDKRFKGSHQEVNNIFDNMERWASYMVRKGINNKSAKSLVDASLKYLPDEVRQVENVAHGMRDNTFSIWENGHKVMYEFKDPLFVHAFTGMESLALPALEGFAKFTNILRQNIVLNPLFSLGQLSQDAFGAMLSSGLKHPFAIPLEVMKEFGKTLRGTSKTHEALKRTGTVGIRDYSAVASRVDAEIAAGLKAPTKFQKFKQPFEKLSMASDNAVRQAIYNRTLLETGGKKMPDGSIVGGDKATAVERAFEIINFRRAGASKEIAALRRTVPFFGAYLQSLNVATKVLSGRGISPTARAEAYKVLAQNMAKVMVAGFIYNTLISEDEGYKKLDPTVRDRHLVIPGTDGMMIPLRSDVFTLMSKIIPEHLYQMTLAETTEDGTKAAKAIKTAVANSILSPNVTPQAVKPLVEVYLNKNMWTGQPIVGQGQENLETAMQYGPNTSQLAKVLGKTGVMSPLSLDYLLKSYFGYTGATALMATDALIANLRGETIPDKSGRDMIAGIPGMSTFVSKEFGTRDMNDFYELKALTTQKVATLNKLKENGSMDEAREYMEKNKALIAASRQVNRISENLSNLKKQERQIMESDLSGAEKQQRLTDLKTREHLMVSKINELRKYAGL